MVDRILLLLLFIGMVALGGCSTTAQDLETKRSTDTAVYTYAENYQEIYRRIATTAKTCVEGNIMLSLSTRTAVDTQLYSELGFGEISYSIVNATIHNFYWKAKVERADQGSKLTIYSGNTTVNHKALNMVKRWADGDYSCPIM